MIGAIRCHRPIALALLVAAFVGLGLAMVPDLCHPEDEGCEASPWHHATTSCTCSCHMAALAPLPDLGPQDRALGVAALATTRAVSGVDLTQPTPPPRG